LFPFPSCKGQNGASATPLPSERTEFGPWQNEGMVSSSPNTRSQPRGGLRRQCFAFGFFAKPAFTWVSRLSVGNTAVRRSKRAAESPKSRPSKAAATARGVTLVGASVQRNAGAGPAGVDRGEQLPLDPKGLRTQAQRIMKAHSKPTKAPGRRRTSHSKHTHRNIAHGQPQCWNQQSTPVQLALTEQGYIRRCVGCTQLPRLFPRAFQPQTKKTLKSRGRRIARLRTAPGQRGDFGSTTVATSATRAPQSKREACGSDRVVSRFYILLS
jgi:hypothetical protein